MSSSYVQGCVTRCWNGRVPRETDNIEPQEAGGWNVIKLCTRLCNKMLEWERDRQHNNCAAAKDIEYNAGTCSIIWENKYDAKNVHMHKPRIVKDLGLF